MDASDEIPPGDLLAEAGLFLQQNLEVDSYSGALQKAALEHWLTDRILGLLHAGRTEFLLQVCYRVDLDEEKVQNAFALREPPVIAAELAHLLLARELRKAQIRREYRPAPES